MEWQQLLRKAEIERSEKRRYPNEWEQKVSIGKSFRFLFFALPVCHLSDHERTCKFEELPKDSTQIFSQTRLLWYHFIRALTNENFATVLWLRFASWYGNENIFGNKMISSEFLLRFLNDEESSDSRIAAELLSSWSYLLSFRLLLFEILANSLFKIKEQRAIWSTERLFLFFWCFEEPVSERTKKGRRRLIGTAMGRVERHFLESKRWRKSTEGRVCLVVLIGNNLGHSTSHFYNERLTNYPRYVLALCVELDDGEIFMILFLSLFPLVAPFPRFCSYASSQKLGKLRGFV